MHICTYSIIPKWIMDVLNAVKGNSTFVCVEERDFTSSGREATSVLFYNAFYNSVKNFKSEVLL